MPHPSFPKTLFLTAAAAVGSAVGITSPRAVLAQEADRPASGETMAAVAASLEPGARLRLAWNRGRLDTGRFRPDSAGALGLATESGTLRIPFAEVDSAWVGRTRATAGAALGGFIGGVAGGLSLWGLSEALCEAPGGCSGPEPEAYLLLVGGGAAVGAALGAVVGSGTIRWEIAFPARE